MSIEIISAFLLLWFVLSLLLVKPAKNEKTPDQQLIENVNKYCKCKSLDKTK